VRYLTNLACHSSHAFGGGFEGHLTDLVCSFRAISLEFGMQPVCRAGFLFGGFLRDSRGGLGFVGTKSCLVGMGTTGGWVWHVGIWWEDKSVGGGAEERRHNLSYN
jgi:hypothetical protein